MDPNRPRRRRKLKWRAVEPTNPTNNIVNEQEGPNANLPLHVESSVDFSATEEMELPETPVTGAVQRTQIRNWAAEFSKRNRALKQNTPTPVAKKFICSVCKRELGNKNSLKRHMRRHTGEKPYLCKSCPESFDRMDKLRNHERMHLQASLSCKYCKNEFRSLNLLRIHIDRVHTHKKTRNKSTTAASSSSKTSSVQQKRFNQSPLKFESKAPLHKRKCDQCGCIFSSLGNLARHKRIHMSRKPFQCTICQAGFTRKYVLTNHLLAHARGTLKKIPYKFKKCRICGAGCNRNFNVIQHMKKVHPTEDYGSYLTQRMMQVFDYWERRARAKKVKKAREDASGRILQSSLIAKPLKTQLLQKKKNEPSSTRGNKQQRHVPMEKFPRKKNIVHLPPLIGTPLLTTSIPVTAEAPSQVEVVNGTHSPPSLRPQASFRLETHPTSSKTCSICNEILGTDHELTVHSLVFHPTKDCGVECGICEKRCRSIYLLSTHYVHNHGDSKNALEEAIMVLNNFINAPTVVTALDKHLAHCVVLDEVKVGGNQERTADSFDHNVAVEDDSVEEQVDETERTRVLLRLRSPHYVESKPVESQATNHAATQVERPANNEPLLDENENLEDNLLESSPSLMHEPTQEANAMDQEQPTSSKDVQDIHEDDVEDERSQDDDDDLRYELQQLEIDSSWEEPIDSDAE